MVYVRNSGFITIKRNCKFMSNFIKQRDENTNYYGDINLHMKGIENIISKKLF